MKTAIKKIVAVDLCCPYCGAEIHSPSGQIAWDVNTFPAGEIIACAACDKKCKTPRVG
jgi:hypothetical protein